MEIKYFIIAALLLSAATTGTLSTYSILNFRTAGAKSYTWLLACITVYSFGYALELYSTTLDEILIASKIQYLGIPFIPAFWLMVAARYAGYWKSLPRILYFPLFIIPMATFLLHLTDGDHHLVYKTVTLNESGPFPLLNMTRGAWYYVQVVYTYVCFLAGNFLFIGMAYKAVGTYRKQAMALAAISLLPWVADIGYQSGLSPYGVDLAPFGFAIAGPSLAWGIFRLRIFDFVPIARDTIFESMHDPVVVFDNAGRLADYNHIAASMFPILDKRSLGSEAKQVLASHPDLLKCMRDNSTEKRDIQIRYRNETRIFESSSVPMTSKMGRPVGKILMLHEVTEQRELTEQLRTLATLDGLTGIYNHRHLMALCQKELDRARRHGRPVTLLLADLDHFKEVNDMHGHQAGDEVLREAAAVFQKNLRSSDILGRYGGEEFAVLLPETLPQCGKDLANRIRRELAELSIRHEGQDIAITASFGVTGSRLENGNSDTLASLFQRADKMLYKAKNTGRNVVIQAEENNA